MCIRDSNEAVFAIQGNRNPFIDHPEYVGLIWNTCNGDNLPPTDPTNLIAIDSTENSISLDWDNSSDNVGVAGYNIYQDGQLVQTVVISNAIVDGLNPSTSYSFYVVAFDAAGNESGASNTITETTKELCTSNCINSDLIISAVYDGPLSQGTPKGIELFVLNDIPDLSIYAVSYTHLTLPTTPYV